MNNENVVMICVLCMQRVILTLHARGVVDVRDVAVEAVVTGVHPVADGTPVQRPSQLLRHDLTPPLRHLLLCNTTTNTLGQGHCKHWVKATVH